MRAALHIISDQQRHRLPLEEALLQGALGGADVVQIRQKRAPAAETYAFLRRLSFQCREARVDTRLFINDRVDVAIAAGAAGVHLAAKSLPLEAVRFLRQETGWSGLIGCSVHSLDEAIEAETRGADYVTFGHVFATSSHAGVPPRGTQTLAEIVQGLSIPVIAIGGIIEENVEEVLQTGCSGIAVIGAILESEHPRRAAQSLRDRIARSRAVPRVPFPTIARGGGRGENHNI